MDVSQVMTPNPVTVAPTTSVLNARRLLRRHAVRHLPVLDAQGRLAGIVSDRDVQLTDQHLVDSLTALRSDLVMGRYRQVATVMTTRVRTVTPATPLARAGEILRRHRIGALPVVSGGRLVGILSASDCLAHVDAVAEPASREPLREHLAAMPAGDERPGRPAGRSTAFVIDPDAQRRLRTAARLTERGFAVRTCPAPLSNTTCPAATGPAAPCDRLPEDVTVVVVDEETARTKLVETYRAWRPEAAIRLAGALDGSNPQRVG